MQYKLLKQFDKDSIPDCTLDFDDSKISVAWLIKEGYIEPVEKKRYEDLKGNDTVWVISNEWQMNILGYEAYFKLCKAKVSKNPLLLK